VSIPITGTTTVQGLHLQRISQAKQATAKVVLPRNTDSGNYHLPSNIYLCPHPNQVTGL
jgi:hypothetical protein